MATTSLHKKAWRATLTDLASGNTLSCIIYAADHNSAITRASREAQAKSIGGMIWELTSCEEILGE